VDYQFVLWIKAVQLKVNILIWRLFLYQIPTNDNLFRRHILAIVDMQCSSDYGCSDDRKHLFSYCNFFGQFWSQISGWLGFSTAHHGNLVDHLYQFGGVGGFPKDFRMTFNIIWFSVLYIIWEERNERIFNHKVVIIFKL